MSKPNIICKTYGPKPVVTSFVTIKMIGFKVFTCSISSYTDGTDTDSLCTGLKSSCESVMSSPTADRCVYHAPPADRQEKRRGIFFQSSLPLQAVLFTVSNNNERATSLLQHLVHSFLQPIFKSPIEKVCLPA
jgi:hypothetical protein